MLIIASGHSNLLFLHSWRQKVPILYSGRLCRQKLPLPMGIWIPN